MPDTIHTHLAPNHPWANTVQYFPSLDSTNDRLKALGIQGAPHGTAVIAGFQTGGHGRLGRCFHSPEGMGLYLSVLLRPGCPAIQLMHLTCAAAVAACDAVEAAAGFRPGIKWTNDLVWGSRKLGGILTELRLTPRGDVDYAVIGIGINCRQQETDFPPELRSMAGSLAQAGGKDISPALLAAEMLNALEAMDRRLLTEKANILDTYRRDCVTLGREISVLRGDTVRHGTAMDVDTDGALVVAYPDGTTEAVNSGEVSIRGMYGYV